MKNFLNKTAFYLIFLFSILLAASCKKDMAPPIEVPKPDVEISRIDFGRFKQSVNLNNLGFLKQRLSTVGQNERIMSLGTDGFLSDLLVYTDTIERITSKTGVSYVFRMPLASPRSTSFRNLTIEVSNNKTSAFIATYAPTAKWIRARKENKLIPFDGAISVTRVNLESTNIKDAVATIKAGPGEKLMSVGNRTMTFNLCTTYLIYAYTPYGCSSGNHMPDDMSCVWNEEGATVPPGETKAGYSVKVSTVTVCEEIMDFTPPPPSGGGGSTTPAPPPGYDPCDGLAPTLSFKFERGTRLAVLPPSPCDQQIVPEDLETVYSSNAQYLFSILSISDGARKNFLNAHPEITNDMVAYLATNGNTVETRGFLNWAAGYLTENQTTINFDDFKRDFLTGDVGLDTSDLGTDGSSQNMDYSIYFDEVEGSFKPISKSDPNYNSLINNGTTNLPTNFAPCTTHALRKMGRDKGWDVGVSPLEFNRRVGQAFQEAVFKLYKQKLLAPQLLRVKYQPQNNISTWRAGKAINTGKVIPDWTYDMSFMGISVPLSQHLFYDAKAVTGALYLSSSKWQIGGYLDVLSRKKVPNAPPPALVFVTPVNTIISPSIIATARSKGVQVRQSFVIIINNKLYLLNSIELTPIHDKFTNIPTNLLKILSGPVDLEWPVYPNNGPDYEEVQ